MVFVSEYVFNSVLKSRLKSNLGGHGVLLLASATSRCAWAEDKSRTDRTSPFLSYSKILRFFLLSASRDLGVPGGQHRTMPVNQPTAEMPRARPARPAAGVSHLPFFSSSFWKFSEKIQCPVLSSVCVHRRRIFVVPQRRRLLRPI